MSDKKTLVVPPWLEGLFVIIVLIMAYVETIHDQWFWAAIFAIAGMGVGLNLITRHRAGDKNDQT